jgi:hypothetical protein
MKLNAILALRELQKSELTKLDDKLPTQVVHDISDTHNQTPDKTITVKRTTRSQRKPMPILSSPL